MKVNIYVTEEVSDAERKEISQLLGVKQASRDQLKEFLWTNGANWRTGLASSVVDGNRVDTSPAEEDLASLL